MPGWGWACAHQFGGGAGPVHIMRLGLCTPGWGWCWASAHQVGGGAGPVYTRLGVVLGQCTSGWGGAGPVHIRLGVGLGQCTSG